MVVATLVALLTCATGQFAAVAAAPTPTPTPSAPSTPAPKPPVLSTFGGGPANAKGLDGRTYFQFLTGPGSQFSDRFAVVNLGKRTETLNVYPVDATSGKDGTFVYPPRVDRPKLAGSWLSLGTAGGKSTVTVSAHHAVVIPIRVTVPENAPPGDHGAGIIVSLTSLVTGRTPGSSSTSAKFEQRVGTKVLIRVAGPLHPKLEITNTSASYDGSFTSLSGGATVTYTVRNTGNVILGATQKVSVSGLFVGAKAAALPVIPGLLPGAEYPVRVHVGHLRPVVHLTAHVSLHPLALAGTVTPGYVSPAASIGFWAIPWLLVLLLLAVLALIVGVVALRRRSARRATAGRHRAVSAAAVSTQGGAA